MCRPLLIIISIISLIAACGSSADEKPEDVVSKYFQAYASNDWVTMAGCLGEDITQSELEELEFIYEGISRSITNLHMTPIAETENQATVAVSFGFKAYCCGRTIDNSYNEILIELERSAISDKWIITEEFDPLESKEPDEFQGILEKIEFNIIW